jgi:hypothetical protein
VANIRLLPFAEVDSSVQEIMRTYDKEYMGSDFVRAFAHAPEVFKSFVDYYFPLIFETRGSVDMCLTEMTRLKVAEQNDCNL